MSPTRDHRLGQVLLLWEDHSGGVLGRGSHRLKVPSDTVVPVVRCNARRSWLQVVDSAPLREVSVRPEASPLEVTILVRRSFKDKRWRLHFPNRRGAEKLISEVQVGSCHFDAVP